MIDAPIDIEVRRKAYPDQPSAFECVICQRVPRPDPWHPDKQRSPVCRSCEIHHGLQGRPVGITRGDFRQLKRLDAMRKALDWEVARVRFPF